MMTLGQIAAEHDALARRINDDDGSMAPSEYEEIMDRLALLECVSCAHPDRPVEDDPMEDGL